MARSRATFCSLVSVLAPACLAAALCTVVTGTPRVSRAADDFPYAAPPAGYFYHALPYGSDATFHPVRELINGALGVLQISSNWKTLDAIDWRNGFDVTWRSITHPIRTTDAYGWEEMLTSEVVPGQLRWSNLQYVPNYHLHLIGGGARHRAFVEWYGAHGFAHPGLWAAATTTVHSFLVETVEHEAARTTTVDPVADMLLFDPAGALLFSSDRVAGFFAHRLHMAIWSGQPMYNPAINAFENAGENYGLHYFFRDTDRVGIFQYWGMSDLFGVTVRQGAGYAWSLGAGVSVSDLQEEARGTGMSAFYARLKWDAGWFLHRNGSLLASVHVSEAWTQRLRANVYPGLVWLGGVTPGLYLGVRRSDVIFGVSLAALPAGLAAGLAAGLGISP